MSNEINVPEIHKWLIDQALIRQDSDKHKLNELLDYINDLRNQIDKKREDSYRFARKYGTLRARINSALIAADELK